MTQEEEMELLRDALTETDKKWIQGLDRIEEMAKELAYLQGIEAAVMVFSYDKPAASATWWALMAMPEASDNSFAREVFESVAKALEAKP